MKLNVNINCLICLPPPPLPFLPLKKKTKTKKNPEKNKLKLKALPILGSSCEYLNKRVRGASGPQEEKNASITALSWVAGDAPHFCVHLYNICGEASALKAELCYHRYVHFACVPIYIFGLHHKQCAGD